MNFLKRINPLKALQEKNQQFHAEKAQGVCPQCKTKIDPTAKKCPQCQSSLDWRRRMNIGNTFLALLVTLLTIFSIIRPLVKSYTSQKNSNLNFSVAQVRLMSTKQDDPGDLVFVNVNCVNTGERPGFVDYAMLHFVMPKTDTVLIMTAGRDLDSFKVSPQEDIMTAMTFSRKNLYFYDAQSQEYIDGPLSENEYRKVGQWFKNNYDTTEMKHWRYDPDVRPYNLFGYVFYNDFEGNVVSAELSSTHFYKDIIMKEIIRRLVWSIN